MLLGDLNRLDPTRNNLVSSLKPSRFDIPRQFERINFLKRLDRITHLLLVFKGMLILVR